MTARLTDAQRAVRALRELGLAKGVWTGAGGAGVVVWEVPDWAAAAVRSPKVNLGYPGWLDLLRALLDDGELRDAVAATYALSTMASTEALLRSRVPGAFAWADAWAEDGRIAPAGGAR